LIIKATTALKYLKIVTTENKKTNHNSHCSNFLNESVTTKTFLTIEVILIIFETISNNQNDAWWQNNCTSRHTRRAAIAPWPGSF